MDSCPLCQSGEIHPFLVTRGRDYQRCANCRLVFLGELNSSLERSHYASDSYDQVQSKHRLHFREVLFNQTLLEIARMKEVGRLLDVGSGDGTFLRLAKERGWDPYGVELSPAACERAKRISGIHIVQGELSDAQFPSDFFDVVTLHNVLDHVPDPLKVLRDAHRVLKRRGLLFVRVPNAAFHVNLIRISPVLEPYLVFHVFCFSPKTIHRCLEKAGYTGIVVRNSTLAPADPYQISPVGGDAGMQLIKSTVHAIAQTLFYISAGGLILGPSLRVHAEKPFVSDQAQCACY